MVGRGSGLYGAGTVSRVHGAVHDTLSGQSRLGRAQLILAMETFFFSVVGLRREA